MAGGLDYYYVTAQLVSFPHRQSLWCHALNKRLADVNKNFIPDNVSVVS